MKERSINVLGKLVFITIMVGVFTPATVLAQQDADTRIDKLESQLKALQDELAKIKAERAAPPVDQKQVETMVDKILAERPSPELGPTDFRVFWKEGLRFETPDKDFSLKIGGRMYYDWGWMRQDSDVKASKGDIEDGTEFRTIRLYTSGTIYDNVDYKVQFDFGGKEDPNIDKRPVLKDVYLGIRDLPFGYLKIGHFKEPFGLEELTSSRFITFMERSLANAFVPSRNSGFMLSSTAYDNRATWAAGVFRETGGTGFGQSEGGYNLTGRVTTLPWYEGEGAQLLHVGAAYSFRNPKDTVQYKSTPEAHLAPYFVDTSTLTSDEADILGLECAWVDGPFSLQGEYMYANIDGKNGNPGPNFDGFYIQSSYFLTGEHRKYKTSSGAFDRVKQKENFDSKGGVGAWEIAARYSQIDLNDGSITGGRLKDTSVGLNWYLNPNMRIMWNYVRADLNNVGNADLLLMRFQVDF